MRDDTKLDILWEEMGTANNELAAVKAVTDQVSPLIPKIPKDYSTTETDTGLKWTDGKNIYRKVFSFTYPDSAGYFTVDTITNFASLIYGVLSEKNTSNFSRITYGTWIVSDVGVVRCNAVTDVLSTDASLTIYYTKTTPTREPDEEPETKKATKKKTKKEEE